MNWKRLVESKKVIVEKKGVIPRGLYLLETHHRLAGESWTIYRLPFNKEGKLINCEGLYWDGKVPNGAAGFIELWVFRDKVFSKKYFYRR